MWYKLLWAGLLSAILAFGIPDDPSKDLNTSSVEEDKGGGTDPDGLISSGGFIDPDGQDKGGHIDPNGYDKGGNTDPNG
jgi:hypothetical protein